MSLTEHDHCHDDIFNIRVRFIDRSQLSETVTCQLVEGVLNRHLDVLGVSLEPLPLYFQLWECLDRGD